ncbi:triose-phosphate isomerase [Mechercharimyces sp. CAU 1602]|uniref:triose-phosphate isomerase n=1 Tax=Mechercharimyces sp. CAU 1602 TaxID=2973933 RepID=UPI002162FC22|nr:triose-phosphate isomerase [Mechercharimyces sp. CAU 1602]MCS1352191.1 triose-phosphate isomerase [Mechercharimyces sp. CAU 1602]
MRTPIIAGNWKMNKDQEETIDFIRSFPASTLPADVSVVLCVPFPVIPLLVHAAEETDVAIGAQNMHWENEGAYTGEVSATMLVKAGVEYVILGHSERRLYFMETDEMINRKVKSALASGLTPIVCVGESLAEREAQQTTDVVRKQVLRALAGIETTVLERVVIAYEPVWAIGTGKASTPVEAGKVITSIRDTLREQFTVAVANAVRIQYGGSVKPDNIAAYMAETDIDGALVGGASLDPTMFFHLVKASIGGDEG